MIKIEIEALDTRDLHGKLLELLHGSQALAARMQGAERDGVNRYLWKQEHGGLPVEAGANVQAILDVIAATRDRADSEGNAGLMEECENMLRFLKRVIDVRAVE